MIILVVDNDRIFSTFVADVLLKAGHEVFTAEDGLEALDLLQCNRFDVLFVDYIMPNVDGRTLCRFVQETFAGEKPFTVLMSAIAAEEWEDIRNIGADVYLAKGPLARMKEHILWVLSEPDAAATLCASGKIIGYEDVKPRGITRELLVSKQHFELILHKMSEGIIEINGNGKVVFSNPAILSLFRISAYEIIGCDFLDLFSAQEKERVSALWKSNENAVRKIDSSNPLTVNQSQVTLEIIPLESSRRGMSALAIFNDITQLKTAEKAMIESEMKLRAIFECAEDAIFLKDRDLRYSFVNPAMERLFSVPGEKLYGRRDEEVFPEGSKLGRADNDRRVLLGEIVEEEVLIKTDGGPINFHIQKAPLYDSEHRIYGICGIARDLTDMKQLETRLRQAVKMESIGTLAGGIAHDFNNILSSVLGFTELALDDVEKDSKLERKLQEVYGAGKRARDLVRQILTFARQSDEHLRPISVDTIIREVLQLIRASIPTTISITQNIDSDALIMGNPTQVHQTLMNLCTNAAQAMEDEGGNLHVTLGDVRIDGASKIRTLNLAYGDYVEIKVSDTGKGIAPEIIDSIFEPYFTTKGPGEGTGMGLAMVHGIVESYGGKITVDSSLGAGTTFSLYLPVTRKGKTERPYETEHLPSGTEHVLFVDDEASIAQMGGEILDRLGYQVATRTSSIEALELFRRKPDAFDLVVTDMTMPNMTGDKLAVELMKIRPDIPVILCTGYSKKISEGYASQIGIKAFAYKPIVKADLAKTVRKVLDAGK